MDDDNNMAMTYEDTDADVRTENDSWERFMILWSVTPEILIGSCLLSLIGIIATYHVTSRNRSQGHKQEVIPYANLDEDDVSSSINGDKSMDEAESTRTRFAATDDESLTRTSRRRHHHHHSKDATADVLSKKNLFKFVSDKMQKTMTDEQLSEEHDIKQKQLEAIYNLMKSERELFGIRDIRQIEDQMKLYG